MNLADAYRLAVAEGLTAKQAGKKFGVNSRSLAKVKSRYGFPTLPSEWEAKYKERFSSLNDQQLKSYYLALVLPKNYENCKREREAALAELRLRKVPA